MWNFSTGTARSGGSSGVSKTAGALKSSNGPKAQRAAAARRLAISDLVAGDFWEAASRDLEEFRSAGGTGFDLASASPAAEPKVAYILVPGPLRSFARMAALSPDRNPTICWPPRRNVVTSGYQASNSNEALNRPSI